MKSKKTTILISLVVITACAVSIHFLNLTPVTFFVLQNKSGEIKAYQVEVFFAGHPVEVTPIALSSRQTSEANKIAEDRDLSELKDWSKSFGGFNFVADVLGDDDFASTWNRLFETSNHSLSDLTVLDKIYLSSITNYKISTAGGNQTVVSSKPLEVPTKTVSAAIALKTPVLDPIVRVEILNGCGIKGAADRVAGRVKNDRIEVKNGGNAANFAYVNTQVMTASGEVPAGLIKALTQIGFANIKGVKTGDISKDYDVVLIVGKDFRKLKGN
jgi:hypothetical protein